MVLPALRSEPDQRVTRFVQGVINVVDRNDVLLLVTAGAGFFDDVSGRWSLLVFHDGNAGWIHAAVEPVPIA